MVGYLSARTIYLQSLLMAKLKNTPYSLIPNTTLNEKFDILPTDSHPVDEYPSIKYYTIGNGGLNTFFNTNYKHSNHKVTDAALFNHIPFVIRESNDDLTLEERAIYRFRKEITIEGIDYVEYYLRIIDDIDNAHNSFKVSVSDNIPIISEFSFNDSSILNPEPTTNTLPTTDSTDFITLSQLFKFQLSTTDIEEIKNAIQIKYGVDADLSLSELGLCTGYDVDLNGSPEAISTQIGYHIPLDYNLEDLLVAGDIVNRNIEIGGMEPIKI